MGSYIYSNNKKDLIGKGAFGEVYKKNEYIQVAVKVIEKDKITKKLQKSWESIKEIIEHEINNMNKCQSINVVKILEYSFTNDAIEIKMELCDKTLEQYRIEKGGTLSILEIKDIFIQLNNALKYLNENNIIHRDLKLENVLIKIKENKNIIKLGDFGLSKYIHENEIITSICGTPAYMAPEIINGSYVSNADIWSIGVMLYILRYGKNPSFKDVYKLDQSNLYNEEDSLLLNLLNRIFEEPNKRITWNEYFSDKFFKIDGNNENIINLNEKKNTKIISDIKEEITYMLILYNHDLCVSSKDQILIYNTNNFNLKVEFIVNQNFIINHLLSLEENLIGASLDDGYFYFIKLYNDNCYLNKYKRLEAKKKISITIKLRDEPEILVSGCESYLIFWKKNKCNEYEKNKIINYEGKLSSLIEYPNKYLIGTLNFSESIKIFSLNNYKEIKTFEHIICTGYHSFSSTLDEDTLIIVGDSFYIFDLEKLELINSIKYDYYIDSIVKFGESYFIGITINNEEEDFYQLHQVIYDRKSEKLKKIAYKNIHKGNIISILLDNNSIITGSCDKTIKIFK